MKQPATGCDYCDYIIRSAILVLPQQKFAGGKYPDSRENGLHDKTFRIQSSHFKFRIQNLWRHDQTGEFLFWIRHLCVNGKTNPVLTRSGLVKNPEQFPLPCT